MPKGRMKDFDTTQDTTGFDGLFYSSHSIPVLLIAHSAEGVFDIDRCAILKKSLTMGRDSSCDLTGNDTTLSRHHFQISRQDQRYFIEDMGSKNGTWLNGERVGQKVPLEDQSIVRAGKSVFVFLQSGSEFLKMSCSENYGMAGRFYSGRLIESLKMAALSGRHLLLSGPSGTGKELAAHALCHILGENGVPLKIVSYNAARFSSEEEATTTLFGVGVRVFSNVDARQGLIEQAHNGALFLDEVHNLPERVQRSLLRVIEDGLTGRIGENTNRPCSVRFILASNQDGPTRGLAHDLFARLRMVELPSLSERRADIPSIFEKVLEKAFARQKQRLDIIHPLLRAKHYEALCLEGFAVQNIRGLIDAAERIATALAVGKSPEQALVSVFEGSLSCGVGGSHLREIQQQAHGSKYEQDKELIIKTFYQQKQNLSATERVLKEQGVLCSRRWLKIFLQKWGIGDLQ